MDGVAEAVKDGALIDVQLRGIHPLKGRGLVRIQHEIGGVSGHPVQGGLGEGHLDIGRVAGLPDVQEAGVERPVDVLVEGDVERPGQRCIGDLHQARRYRILNGDGYVGGSHHLVARQVRDGSSVDVQLGRVHHVDDGGLGGVQLERGKGALDLGRPREGNPAAGLVRVPDVEEGRVDRKGHQLAKVHPDGVAVWVVDGLGDGRRGLVVGQVGDQPQDTPAMGRVGGASRLKDIKAAAGQGQAGDRIHPEGVADVEHLYTVPRAGHQVGAAVCLQGRDLSAVSRHALGADAARRGPDRLGGIAHVHQIEAGAGECRHPGAAPDCQGFHIEAFRAVSGRSKVVDAGQGGVIRVGHVQYLHVDINPRADCRVGAVPHHERVGGRRITQMVRGVRAPSDLALRHQVGGVGEVRYTHHPVTVIA